MSQIRDIPVAADPRESQSPVGLTQIPGRLISALCTVPSTAVQLRLFLYHNFDIDIVLYCPTMINLFLCQMSHIFRVYAKRVGLSFPHLLLNL